MPANLSPDYLAAERDYKQAGTQAEKVAALERMLSTVPKHKGTEKLQADIKRRLSQARKESQKKGAVHSTPFYLVPREGAGQVVLIGPPNSGKSQLVVSLTNARPEVADYPFTTRMPTPGMMPVEDVQIQLVDLPPFSREFMEQWLPQVVRNADLGALVVAADDADALEEIDFIYETLARHRLREPALMIATKADVRGAGDNLAILSELYGNRCPMVPVSSTTGTGFEFLKQTLFDLLKIVRVYTKVPGKKADMGVPYILRRGQTVEDAAKMVHKDFAEQLKFAKLFTSPETHEGRMVERKHLVEDRDILEFHI